jgi:hypothetical protein
MKTRQAGQQGKRANKAGGPTRQADQQGRQARSIDVPTLTANVFAVATNRTNKTKQGRLAGSISSPPKYSLYYINNKK